MPDAIPPQRVARTKARRNSRPLQPKIKADEKAAMAKVAKTLAKEVNEELVQLRAERPSQKYSTLEQRRAANDRANKRRREARKKAGLPSRDVCKGRRWDGKPCRLAPLIPENWEGSTVPTGLYCIHHEPNITRDETEAFLLHKAPNKPLPRKVTPGELAHHLVTRSPQAILEPYLKALGLNIDEETGDLVKATKGLRLYGYSRGGTVVRSPYEDIVGQVNVAEKLFDRVYGKPRQAVDLASSVTTVAVRIEMTTERVDKVTGVLMQAGVLQANGHTETNGNGNGELLEIVEGTAEDLEA